MFNDGGTVAVTDSTLSANTAGGGVYGGGGGLSNTGTAALTNSTISANTAGGGEGDWDPSYSGGGGGVFNIGKLTLSGSTVSANTADVGGGVFNLGGQLFIDTGTETFPGQLTVSGSTVADNGGLTGGNLDNQGFGKLTLANTIVAHARSGGDVTRSGEPGETLTLLGVNLVEHGASPARA